MLLWVGWLACAGPDLGGLETCDTESSWLAPGETSSFGVSPNEALDQMPGPVSGRWTPIDGLLPGEVSFEAVMTVFVDPSDRAWEYEVLGGDGMVCVAGMTEMVVPVEIHAASEPGWASSAFSDIRANDEGIYGWEAVELQGATVDADLVDLARGVVCDGAPFVEPSVVPVIGYWDGSWWGRLAAREDRDTTRCTLEFMEFVADDGG